MEIVGEIRRKDIHAEARLSKDSSSSSSSTDSLFARIYNDNVTTTKYDNQNMQIKSSQKLTL